MDCSYCNYPIGALIYGTDVLLHPVKGRAYVGLLNSKKILFEIYRHSAPPGEVTEKLLSTTQFREWHRSGNSLSSLFF